METVSWPILTGFFFAYLVFGFFFAFSRQFLLSLCILIRKSSCSVIILNYSLPLWYILKKEEIPESTLCRVDYIAFIGFICSNSHSEEDEEILN